MPATPLDILAEELGAVAGRIERESGLRIEAAIADLRRIDAERELRLVNLERSVADRLASVRNGDSVTIEQLAPVVQEAVQRAIEALPPAEPGRSVTAEEVRPMLQAMVDALPVPKDGDSVTVEQLAPVVEEAVGRAVGTLPPAKDGQSVTVEQLAPVVEEAVARAVSALPVPKDGDSVTVEQLAPVVEEAVAKAVSALPAPKDGQSVTVEHLAPVVEEAVALAVSALPVPKDGERGPEGRLPLIKAWDDTVHYEGDVVTHGGATWQAARDTGHAPPHGDWLCVARAGRDGDDGLSFSIEGTFDAERSDYRRLSVVALNGASFVARRDNPGPCPGDGWQLLASVGKRGQPGERGQGIKGDAGPAGPGVASLQADGEGLLTLINADGSRVECDLYPVLSKIAG